MGGVGGGWGSVGGRGVAEVGRVRRRGEVGEEVGELKSYEGVGEGKMIKNPGFEHFLPNPDGTSGFCLNSLKPGFGVILGPKKLKNPPKSPL